MSQSGKYLIFEPLNEAARNFKPEEPKPMTPEEQAQWDCMTAAIERGMEEFGRRAKEIFEEELYRIQP